MASSADETPSALQAAVAQALHHGELQRAADLAFADETATLQVAAHLSYRGLWSQIVAMLAPHGAKFQRSGPLHWALAQAHFNIRQRGKAEPYLRTTVALKPHWEYAQHALGHHLLTSGRHEEAIPFLRQAAALAPGHCETHRLLGLALAAAGQYPEALAAIQCVLALQPEDVNARQYLEELEELARTPPPANSFNRWPKAAHEFSDMRKLIDSYVIKNIPTGGLKLRPKMGVFTQGSCFARNLAYALRRYDLNVHNMTCGKEHNNTFANRAVVDWLRDGVTDERTKTVENNLGAAERERYLAALTETDVFVYTMGLAAAHFDRQTGEFVMSRSTETNKAALFRRCDFKTSSVQANVDNLLYILAVVRELAPRATMVLTVSPVPLMVTTEFHSAVIADCVSKSTLRVAVHEVISRNLPKVLYWPSFEIVRWLGGHTDSVYGDDGSAHHVNESLINCIMDSFINVFGDTALKATLKKA